MKLKVLTFTLLASVVVSYSQQPDTKFLDKLSGLREIGRIAREGVEFRRPKFSPDGRWLAFTSYSPARNLWIASLRDLNPELLAKKETMSKAKYFSWSPDSQQIAYRDGVMMKLVDIMSRRVTAYNTVSPFISAPVFNSEGTLAFVANRGLAGNAAAADGDVEKVKRLRPNDSPYLVVAGANEKKRIINVPAQLVGENVIVPYILSPRGEVYLSINGEDIRVTPIKEVGAVPYCFQPALSPDKTKIVFDCTGAGTRLVVYDIRSQKSYSLGHGIYATWSPDSEWILYLDEIAVGHGFTTRMDIYLTHYKGGRRVKLGGTNRAALGISWGRNNLVAYDEGDGEIVISKMLMK